MDDRVEPNNTKPAPQELEYVRVSQATREMAKPATHEVRTIAQEYDDLKKRVKEIEGELSLLKDRESKEQYEIRKGGSNQYTLNQWMARKHELGDERRKLLREKALIDKRMLTIRAKAKEQNRQSGKGSGEFHDPLGPILRQILEELKAIHATLKR